MSTPAPMPTLEDAFARIAELERQAAVPRVTPTGDQIAANPFKINARGETELNPSDLPADVLLSVPAPTGVAAIDMATIESVLGKASAVNGAVFFGLSGTYATVREFVVPHNVSVFGNFTAKIQAENGFAGTSVLSTPAAERMVGETITGVVLDANNIAPHSLWVRYHGQVVIGVHWENATEGDVILGDKVTPAPGNSFQAQFTPDAWGHRTKGAITPGFASVYAEWSTDGRIPGMIALAGQETGIRIGAESGGWKIAGVHPQSATTFPMQVSIEDLAGSTIIATECDTPKPSEHAEATGSAATSVITDALILANHEARPVTGANIPAESFVGKVTSGVSFTLVNAEGVEVKPAGEVKGITLGGVGHLMKASAFRLIACTTLNNPGPGPVDLGSYGIVIGPKVASGHISGFKATGLPEYRLAKAIAGKTSVITWQGLIQQNCATTIPAIQIPEHSLPPTAIEELTWQPVEELNAKLEHTEGYPEPQCAIANGMIYLIGGLTTKEETTGSAEQIFKLPASCRPKTKRSRTIFNSNGTYTTITIEPNGKLVINQKVPAAKILDLGVSFPAKP